MPRSSKIIAMTSEEVKNKMKKYADGMGLTVSALAAYIIGQWVYNQDRVMPMMERVAREVIPPVTEMTVPKGDSSERSEAKNP